MIEYFMSIYLLNSLMIFFMYYRDIYGSISLLPVLSNLYYIIVLALLRCIYQVFFSLICYICSRMWLLSGFWCHKNSLLV